MEEPCLPKDLSEIIRHLEACYPEEGCGVILQAEATEVLRIRFLPNAYDRYRASDPARFPRTARTAYLFEPGDWLAVCLEADARRERIVCVFHSHTNGNADFSPEDRAQAAPAGQPLLPGTAYLVVALSGGRATQARLFRWTPGGFRERPVPLWV